MRGISGPRKDTPFSPGQELAKARKVVEGIILNNKNKELMPYIKDIAELRTRGHNSFVAGIKKISDLAMKKVRVSEDKIRMINLYFNNLDSKETERFIKRFQKSLKLKEVENATLRTLQ